MDEALFGTIKSHPLRKAEVRKELDVFSYLYGYIVSELKRCVASESYYGMYAEDPGYTDYNTAVYTIIIQLLSEAGASLDQYHGTLKMDTRAYVKKDDDEDGKHFKTMNRLEWSYREYLLFRDVKIPSFFNLVDTHKANIKIYKEQLQELEDFPSRIMTPDLTMIRLARANRGRVNGLFKLLEDIESIFRDKYLVFCNVVDTALLKDAAGIESMDWYYRIHENTSITKQLHGYLDSVACTAQKTGLGFEGTSLDRIGPLLDVITNQATTLLLTNIRLLKKYLEQFTLLRIQSHKVRKVVTPAIVEKVFSFCSIKHYAPMEFHGMLDATCHVRDRLLTDITNQKVLRQLTPNEYVKHNSVILAMLNQLIPDDVVDVYIQETLSRNEGVTELTSSAASSYADLKIGLSNGAPLSQVLRDEEKSIIHDYGRINIELEYLAKGSLLSDIREMLLATPADDLECVRCILVSILDAYSDLSKLVSNRCTSLIYVLESYLIEEEQYQHQQERATMLRSSRLNQKPTQSNSEASIFQSVIANTLRGVNVPEAKIKYYYMSDLLCLLAHGKIYSQQACTKIRERLMPGELLAIQNPRIGTMLILNDMDGIDYKMDDYAQLRDMLTVYHCRHGKMYTGWMPILTNLSSRSVSPLSYLDTLCESRINVDNMTNDYAVRVLGYTNVKRGLRILYDTLQGDIQKSVVDSRYKLMESKPRGYYSQKSIDARILRRRKTQTR